MALTASIFPSDMVKGRGRIEVILGPMFSGKTTELIRRITRYQFAKMKCLVLKYANDVRYSKTEVATHDSRTLSALSCISLQEYKSKALDYDVLGIDEGQFFPDILNFCEELANEGKIIVVAALDGTYQRTGFGDILNLVPLAESIIKLHAVCMRCCGNASFTKRITDEKAVELIGGADKYMSVCRECYHLPSRKRSLNENKVSPLKELNGKVPSPKKVKNSVDFCDKGTSPLKEINGVVKSPLKILNGTGVGSPFKKLNGVVVPSPKKVKKVLDLDENGVASPLKKINAEMASPMKVMMALSL